MIQRSTTYRQQSKRTPAIDTADPENHLLGRMNLRRLEAEAIRDAILSVSGQIDLTLGGVSIPVTLNGEGKAVVGGPPANAARRSAFVQVQRNLPLNMLATFDQPTMDPNCELRSPSTVATQSLWFLNDTLIIQHADDITRLLYATSDTSEDRLRLLYKRLFAATITDRERQMCMEFLSNQTERLRRNPDAGWQKTLKNSPDMAERRAFASLCQTLLASNRFLYID